MEKSKLLEVDSFQLEELQVERNPDYSLDAQVAPPDVEFSSFMHQTDARRFAVSLTVKSPDTEKAYPLRFSTRIVGVFTVAETFADGKLNGDRVVNGLTILYGIVRGHLMTATSWFDKPCMIPTVYFTDLVNAKIAEARKIEAGGDRPALEASSA